MGLVVTATVFCITNFSINARLVRSAVVADYFSANGSYIYRLPAAQIAASSLSFITCIAFLILYVIIALIIGHNAKNLQLGGSQQRRV